MKRKTLNRSHLSGAFPKTPFYLKPKFLKAAGLSVYAGLVFLVAYLFVHFAFPVSIEQQISAVYQAEYAKTSGPEEVRMREAVRLAQPKLKKIIGG